MRKLNTVPDPSLPPYNATPYRMLPDAVNDGLTSPGGLAGGGKLYRVAKPVPSGLSLNSVPEPELPPYAAVPYKVLPDNVKPAHGAAPSLSPLKACNVVKPVPFVLTAKTVPLLKAPPRDVVPYRLLLQKTNDP